MSLQVKNIVLGEGTPKICVPITGKSQEEILSQAEKIIKTCPDLVEWRADFYDEILTEGKAEKVLDDLQEILGETPILFTFRTAAEGGNQEILVEEYTKLLLKAARQGTASLIDVEVYKEDLDAEALIDAIHRNRGLVVASNHHFDQTPFLVGMMEILAEMEDLGADVLKLAVMPKKPEDVLNLLQATLRTSARTPRPVITMSMGRLGTVSRISGGVFGSAVTFASAGEASAPGQLPIEEMRRILKYI